MDGHRARSRPRHPGRHLAGGRDTQEPTPYAGDHHRSGCLALLGVTLFLLLQVMRPQSVSFDEVQRSGGSRATPFRPLRKWKDTIESQQDLYLPCGVKCLTSLRQGMIIEELTLFALAKAISTCTPEDREILEMAQMTHDWPGRLSRS
jgi:hypothetical protein